MNTITQEELDKAKEMLASSTEGEWTPYWRVNEEGHADCGITASLREGMGHSVCRAPRYQTKAQWLADGEFMSFLHNHAPALIAAAEEGLKVPQLKKELDAVRVCFAEASHNDCQAGPEIAVLRDRVQELEEAMDKIQALARDREIGEEGVHLMRIENIIAALSNSTTQPPRYTLEGWQDIETAPKNSSKILVAYLDHVTIGWWDDQKYHQNPKPHFSTYLRYGTRWHQDTQPNYWMPIPLAPQQKEGE